VAEEMVTKDELLDMIDHSIHYSGESYAQVFYRKYIDAVDTGALTDAEKAECRSLLETLREGAARHIEALRALRERVETDDRRAY